LRETIDSCLATGRRVGPVGVDAVSRLGRAITCSITCSPLDGRDGGVVLLMEETRRA
jgi:two-component system CheB/CheR fusion protein